MLSLRSTLLPNIAVCVCVYVCVCVAYEREVHTSLRQPVRAHCIIHVKALIYR